MRRTHSRCCIGYFLKYYFVQHLHILMGRFIYVLYIFEYKNKQKNKTFQISGDQNVESGEMTVPEKVYGFDLESIQS